MDKQGRHFIVAKFINRAGSNSRTSRNEYDETCQLLVQHPGRGPAVLALSTFFKDWNGEFIFFASKASFAGEASAFDFTWFIPALIKYRRLLGEVLLISIVLQLIGLVTPVAFQVITDKVLVNHATRTLNVVAIGLICATIFDVVLSGIRTHLFSHTCSKIDVELGAKLFKHLLSLPIGYFESRRVGDSIARVRELENIRSFLTSNSLTLLLDLLFSVVLLSVMLWYSGTLTLIVAASLPVYFAISLVFTPLLRNRLNEKFNRGADNQAFLVETVANIETVKSLAVEPRWQQKWEKKLASYVTAGVSTTNIATFANSSITLISKGVNAAIIWFGARLVLDGRLSVGELIAVNMLAAQVAAPVLRLAQLWNDFQQVGISVQRLGDILNTRVESTSAKARLPRLAGVVEFENVSFRYRPDGPRVIHGINLKVQAGEVIGIVGRSGSGKSTLTKLLQRLYVPEQGRILFDGFDVAVVDSATLRRQLGVVLQENALFVGSVRENIAVGSPALELDHVIRAAKLAGAHDFICELPDGYETVLGEHGTGLSGGQRQRIAIARALISNPRILIFDEATSALDYESEQVIQQSMAKICQGRTVFVIAHRLSAVRAADRIIVMDRGEIVETGTHDQLLSDPRSFYAHLHKLQFSGEPSWRCAEKTA
jgi:subfamily B ATP-binding cassette protein HlyB/CyaB